MSELPSSSDYWDETNITCCGFGPMRITKFGPNLLVFKKKKKKFHIFMRHEHVISKITC